MSSPRHSKTTQETAPTPFDWLLFVVIVAVGGSSFAMIRGAVESVPPVAITVGRLWIGAIFLYIVMRQAGRRLPPLRRPETPRHVNPEWWWIIAISVIGYVGPFTIFPWAQQYIDSGLAGIYMAFMPIWTVFLAAFFAGESFNGRKIVGFLMGFAGVVILIGPAVIGEAAATSIVAQIALLVATFGYAIAAVITRRAPPIRPRAFAAATLICAAILSTPAVFFTEMRMDEWTLSGVFNVIGLGLGPTGLGGVLLIILIQRVGAGFMAFANYLTPLWAVGMGALLFGERLGVNALIALVVILTGVAISQRQSKSARQPISTQSRENAQTKI
jgi:drug/metabolite transporter (DMT)-like permease